MAFTQFDGTAYWDKAGLLSVNDPSEDPALSLAAWKQFEKSLGDKSMAPQEIKDLLGKEPEKLNKRQRKKLGDYFMAEVYADPDSALAPLRKERKAIREERAAVEKDVPSTMISQELEKPRPNWVLGTRSGPECLLFCRRCRPVMRPTGSHWRAGWWIQSIR
jgi:hypothetical protein